MKVLGLAIGSQLTKRLFASILCFAGVCSALAQSSTNIQVTGNVLQAGVHKLGVNLGDQTYWDSGQMMKNLVFQNPGFEGLKFRTILKCSKVTANTCQDDNEYSGDGTGFWKGGPYLILSGKSAGMSGTVVQSTQNPSSCSGCGQIVQFDQNINAAVGDYFVVSNYFPGAGDSGWWDNISGGGTITTETTDLSPNTPGKQAVVLSANGASQHATVTQYFESYAGLSFIQLNGAFQITFRAKGVGGNNTLYVNSQRLQSPLHPYINQTVKLTNQWQDYTLTFNANETGSAVGTVQLVFTASGGSVELDDVSMEQTNSDPTNTTVFRDDVVNTLKQLQPGTLRMMAAGAALGSDIPNQLAPPFARYRGGYSSTYTTQSAIAYGIDEFVHLCAAVGADPWITIPTATTPAEIADLIEYLTGDGSDKYSASRIARGQVAPWTSVFNKIHLELGNETWNGDFKGESMAYPGYPQWANNVFGAARKAPGYQASKFDLIVDGWAGVPGYNAGLLSTSTQHDSIDIAPYLLYSANNESMSTMYGALFAEPELFNGPTGEVTGTMQVAAKNAVPAKVNVYETNLGTMIGSITQAQLDLLTQTTGAGIAHTVHMLEMMRSGVQYQNAFALQQYKYRRGDGSMVRLWGIVVDMGTTNRRRPQFLTQALANGAIGGNMLQTIQSGANPTWNQPLSSDGVSLNGAHYLQSFAFLNQGVLSTVIFNLNLTTSLPVTFSGPSVPSGTVTVSTLTSPNITDNNEFANNVQVATKTLTGFNPAKGLTLPPFSMTVVTNTSAAAQAPSFSLAPGTYGSAQTVTISDPTAGATIYYTLDGSTPSTSSAKYSSALSISKSETLEAMATVAGLTSSPVTSAAYTIGYPQAAAPAFSVPGGSYSAAQSVTISDTTSGATIYYTTDGSTPTTKSTKYAGAIAVASSMTIKAMAIGANTTASTIAAAAYTISIPVPAAMPTFSKPTGTYTTSQLIVLSDATPGATIYYTLDGSTPKSSSTKYVGALPIDETTTVHAIALAANYTVSPIASATYTISASLPPPGIGFTKGEMKLWGSAKLVGTALQLTDNHRKESAEAWTIKKVSVKKFTTDFSFQIPASKSTADGFTFTLQNAPDGPYAEGQDGNALGYAGIPKSVAIKFTLYDGSVKNGASLTSLITNGESPTTKSVDMSPSNISLHSGHVMQVHLSYDGMALVEKVTDSTTGAVFTQTYAVRLSSVLGGSKGYAGFTGGTGNNTALQSILTWSYTPLP